MNKIFVLPEDGAVVISHTGGRCGVYTCGKPAKWCLLTKPCVSEEPKYSPMHLGHECSKECRPDYDINNPQLFCNEHEPELVVIDENFVVKVKDSIVPTKRWKRELEWTLKERPTKRVLVFDE